MEAPSAQIEGNCLRDLFRQRWQGIETLHLPDKRIFERRSQPICHQQQNIGHLWTFQDITQQVKDDYTLKRREQKYQAIIENMSLGLVEVDLDDRVRYVNDSFCEIMGYDEAEMLDISIFSLICEPRDSNLHRQKQQERLTGHFRRVRGAGDLPRMGPSSGCSLAEPRSTTRPT